MPLLSRPIGRSRTTRTPFDTSSRGEFGRCRVGEHGHFVAPRRETLGDPLRNRAQTRPVRMVIREYGEDRQGRAGHSSSRDRTRERPSLRSVAVASLHWLRPAVLSRAPLRAPASVALVPQRSTRARSRPTRADRLVGAPVCALAGDELGRRRPPAPGRALHQHRRGQHRLARRCRRVPRRRASPLSPYNAERGAPTLRHAAALRDEAVATAVGQEGYGDAQPGRAPARGARSTRSRSCSSSSCRTAAPRGARAARARIGALLAAAFYAFTSRRSSTRTSSRPTSGSSSSGC